MLHEDRQRALSFGSDPALYHRTRPSYPQQLVDYLLAGDRWADGVCRVLDVGCGTGLAAELFAGRGCDVLGVEADERMAAFARSRGLTVETSAFEVWDPAGRIFDLVISAQAWHWVDPGAGAHQAGRVLRSGGRVGLFWNRAAHPGDVQAGFESVYHRLAPGLEGYSIVLGQGTGDRFAVAASGLERSGAFGPVETVGFRWPMTYTTRHWLDHLMTHSDHRSLAPDDQRLLLGEVADLIETWGGSFTTEYEAVLVTARRAGGPRQALVEPLP